MPSAKDPGERGKVAQYRPRIAHVLLAH